MYINLVTYNLARQFSSVPQSCLILCNPMDCSRPGFPVHHQLPELAQNSCPSSQSNHLILCHPLLLLPSVFPSIKVFSMSQFFTSGGQSIGASASASFQCILRIDFLEDWLVWSPSCPRDSQESSLAPVWKASILQYSVFFIVQLLHLYMSTGKTIAEGYLSVKV